MSKVKIVYNIRHVYICVLHRVLTVQCTGVPDVWAVKKKRSSAMSIILNSTGKLNKGVEQKII